MRVLIRTSVIIPIWNGSSVIDKCLKALFAEVDPGLAEVICVDNASQDASADLIAQYIPRIRLVRNLVNLGFAGGVNTGIDSASGDVLVLLNQDCIVQPGWLPALLDGVHARPSYGIAGCSIFNSDGSLNHAGAYIRRPDAYGVHLIDDGDIAPRLVEYVTGTAIAILRSTWESVGRFDEGFYPAYYEESDYCIRARRLGIDTVFVPAARAIHLLASHEWEREPLKHTANQHFVRYRFVAKHFDGQDLAGFFQAESQAIEAEKYYDQVVGRNLASRQLLRLMDDVENSRRIDLHEPTNLIRRRQLEAGFALLARTAFASAQHLGQLRAVSVPLIPGAAHASASSPLFGREPALEDSPVLKSTVRQLFLLKQREYDRLTRIYFRQPGDHASESWLARLWRLIVLRPLSYLSGRDDALQREVDMLRLRQMEYVDDLSRLYAEHLAQLQNSAACLHDALNESRRREAQSDARARLLELLVDYEFR